MEFLGPAFELIKTGSPYAAGFMAAVALSSVYIRELRRHYAAEALARQERYNELKANFDVLSVKCDVVTLKWLESEQEKAEIIRGTRARARKAGDS